MRLNDFITGLSALGRRSSTIRAYVNEIKRCFEKYGAACFSDACNLYLNEERSAATIRRRYQALLQYARVFELPLPQEPKKQKRVQKKLVRGRFSTPSSPSIGRHEAVWRRDRACALLSLGAGLSAGEIVSLHVLDVEVSDGNAWLYVEDRRIPLPRLVRRALLEYLMIRGGIVDEGAPLFVGRNGGPLPLRTLQSGIKRFLSDGGTDEHLANARMARRAFVEELLKERRGIDLCHRLVGVVPQQIDKSDDLRVAPRSLEKAANRLLEK